MEIQQGAGRSHSTMHTDGSLSLGPCGTIQTHPTVCSHDTKLISGSAEPLRAPGCVLRGVHTLLTLQMPPNSRSFNSRFASEEVYWNAGSGVEIQPNILVFEGSLEPDSPGFYGFPESRCMF